MSEEQGDLTVAVEAAWVAFRGRLADHLAAIEDDDLLCVEVEAGVDEDELAGTAPYVQFCAFGEDMVRAEAVSNYYLDERYELTELDEERLGSLGWDGPRFDEEGDPESGWENFHHHAERREADRLASMCIETLREVYGAAHPAFLTAGGLEADPDAQVPHPQSIPVPADGDVPPVAFPTSPDELQQLVDATVLPFVEDDEVRHDDDGDIPIVTGQSVLFVRVSQSRPAIELFAEIVVDVSDTDRLPLELAVLNASHPFARFTARGTTVVLQHLLCATPFAPGQLQVLITHLLHEVDDIARDLVARVGGRRFLEATPTVDEEADPDAWYDGHPSLVGLMEILHVRTMTPSSVAALFDHDRRLIVDQIVGLRTGRIGCPEHDLDLVLDHLRRGLSFVAARAARAEHAGERGRSHRPRSQQMSLLSESDHALEAGLWERETS